MKVKCPECGAILGEINLDEQYIQSTKDAELLEFNVSGGILPVPFKCKKCGKTYIEVVTL